MAERLGRLRDYEERLRHGEREQYAAYEEHAASVWADSATLLESLASARSPPAL